MNAVPKHTKHVLHAVLTILSGGLWLPIWLWRSIINNIHNSRSGFSLGRSTSPSLFNLLRIARGFCGLIFALQIIQLLPVFTWTAQPQAVTGNMLGLLTVKVMSLIIFCGLFFGLRWLINSLHTRSHGVPHPALEKNGHFRSTRYLNAKPGSDEKCLKDQQLAWCL